MPDALRAEGLEPVLVAGWERRGYEFPATPLGSLDHHTAGPRFGYMPSLGVLTNGRPDLPGPLAQVGSPRSEPGDWRVYVIASGKANHGGAGYWAGADSNYEMCGLERELVGDGSDLTKHRNDVAIRVHTAFARLCGFPATSVARHAEYALPKGRKPDTAGITGSWLRGAVAARLAGANPQPPEDFTMAGLNRTDALKGVVRQAFRANLLRTPESQAELDNHVLHLATVGYEQYVLGLIQSTEGQAVLARERKAVLGV
ncbi:MAG: hypothetical protein H0W25_13755 [Acidimicrobiia bacterium]|nr:hypothetical protein [Acidimicrobiia bacterium]